MSSIAPLHTSCRYERWCAPSIARRPCHCERDGVVAARLATLFGGGAGRAGQVFLHDLAEMCDEAGHVGSQALEPGLSRVTALVHVERAVDLDLQCMAAAPRVAVMPGGEPAGIGRVERDREIALGEKGTG